MSLLRRLGFFASKSKITPAEAKPNLGHFAWLLHREPAGPAPRLAYSGAADHGEDQDLVRRVMASYRQSLDRHRPSGSGWDHGLVTIKQEIHDALMEANVETAARLLRNPAETTLFWGFDAIAKAPLGSIEPHENVILMLNQAEDWRGLYALWLIELLKFSR